ncbi:unnamed protein product [Porites lobata]|uniref:LamG-like jellyroll fold domain-containing protein n=1 Tax=Porites lobata TaxID=104759 RepID=A0ABN8N7A8_9CNID|nr:unnamed protein product [Porites lobata]
MPMGCVCLVFLVGVAAAWAGLTQDYNQVFYLGFDRYNSERLYDDSQHNNNATLRNALLDKVPGSCGMCLKVCCGGGVEIDGSKFVGTPYMEVMIAMMVQLKDTSGTIVLFETIGGPPMSNHGDSQYQLEVENARIRWFHRNENGSTVFSIVTDGPVLSNGKWFHVAAMYDGLRGSAKIYIDGKLSKQESADPGVFLSRDWSKYAGIGEFGGRGRLEGFIDEFYIYNKTLAEPELKALIQKCQGPKSTMVLHLSFDKKSGTQFLDDSGLMNHARMPGPPAVPGQPIPPPPPPAKGSCGDGVQLSGGQADVKLDGKTFRNKPIDGVTIALWINVSSVNGLHYLFDTIGGHSAHKHDQYLLTINNGAVSWSHDDENDKELFKVITDPIVTENQWIHIAVTYGAQSAQAKIYINGNINKQGPGSGRLSEDWDSYAAFGKHQGSVTDIDTLDEVYMYSRELSPFEVKTLYDNCNFGSAKTPSTGQVFYFGFDRVSGSAVYDDSGSGNNGELTSLATVTKTSGNCGNGLQLHGGNILINGQLVKRKPLFSVTIALWLKLDSNRGQQTIFSTCNPDNPWNTRAQYSLEIMDGRVRWFHRNEKSQTVFSAETNNPVVPALTWTHISCTYTASGGRSEIYVNGVLKKEEFTGSGILSQDWAGKVSIGKSYEKAADGKWVETNPLYGVIDEFYLFERPLKQNEITLLAQTCNYERAVVHYGFDLFTGTTVYDQSGLANNGLAINGTTSSLNGTCGKAVNMTLGQIRLPGDAFREKPQKAITISVWVKLQTNRGRHEIFNTIGSHSDHKHDQYDFAVQDGKVIWYHHQENDKEVFNVVTLPCIPAHNWTHIAVTYDSQAMLAIVYVNGILVKAKSASGDLSQDWGHFAGIGRHFYEGTFLSGLIDEFIVYNYALNGTIRYLAQGRCW